MPDDIPRKHSAVESPLAGAQAAAPLGCDSSQCGEEHGVRGGAGSSGDDPRDTRPYRATRYIETTLGLLSYSELAPLLGGRVAKLEHAVAWGEFASHPLDETILTEFHARICGDLTPEWAGKWRSVEVTVGSLTPPAPYMLPMLMREYALDLQARWDEASGSDTDLTMEFLAFAEGRFLTIHPFRDFNGRTIRVFLNELLLRLTLPQVDLAPESESGRDSYYAALEAADKMDWQPLADIWKSRLVPASNVEVALDVLDGLQNAADNGDNVAIQESVADAREKLLPMAEIADIHLSQCAAKPPDEASERNV